MKEKLKIGIFSFTSCEGCELTIFENSEEFTKMLNYVDIVNSRLIKEKNPEVNLDIAIVEGSIMSKKEAEELVKIRERSKILISLGTCAGSGCVQALRNFFSDRLKKKIIKEAQTEAFEKVKALDEIVKVDYYARGCPIDADDFYRIIKLIINNQIPRRYDVAVCKECKENENSCLLIKGIPCLGPVAYGGCKAICVTKGSYCAACRGVIRNSNVDSLRNVLKDRCKLSDKEINELFQQYNNVRGVREIKKLIKVKEQLRQDLYA
ncbi:MAG: NADH:ubiquinone oxidoreductase [Candidatus Diapherotrites archaeon]|nr:NADH:ubiquinone oxidoreductase [Candidatus Diapherotrites archaeon]